MVLVGELDLELEDDYVPFTPYRSTRLMLNLIRLRKTNVESTRYPSEKTDKCEDGNILWTIEQTDINIKRIFSRRNVSSLGSL